MCSSKAFLCFKHHYSEEDRISDLYDVLDSSMNDPINIFFLGTAIINTYVALSQCNKCMIYLFRKSCDGTFLEPFAIGPDMDISFPDEHGKIDWLATFNRFLKVAINQKKPIISNDIDIVSTYHNRKKRTKIYNFAAIPLVHDEEPVGIVGFIRKDTNFSSRDFTQLPTLNEKLSNVMWRYRKNTSIN